MSSAGGLGAWVQAARPLAQANLAAPLLLGQALAYASTGRFEPRWLLALGLWGVLDQLFIVFANDVADAEHDKPEARTLFSGGSGVIGEGKIERRALARAALIAYAALGLLSLGLAIFASPWALAAWALAGALLHAYSFPPLRRSYRGQGELLQGLGIGGVLPLLGYAVQAGTLEAFPWVSLAPTVLLGIAGNVATALPDHAADRRALKRTWPVRFGVVRAAWGCLGLTVAAVYLALAVSDFRAGWVTLAALPLGLAAWANVRTKTGVLRFVFLQGAATQLVWLGWAAGCVW
ncbi:MAG: prenyltransferase [Sandaracinus sp.]|nr:prenyltransferase [Sandaracinus sp.]